MKEIPLCENCVYYKAGPYKKTGTCTRYVAYRGRGKMVYEFADTVRLDKSRCGPDGKMFLSNPRKLNPVRGDLLWVLFNEDE